jgi:hypothetical protein
LRVQLGLFSVRLCGVALRCISLDEAGHSGCRSASASTVVDRGGASGHPTPHMEKLPFLSFFSLQASSSSTLRFYATHRYVLASRHHDRRLHAYEKFGVLFSPPNPLPCGGVNGLPVRVWRDPTSAISIRKAGPASLYISPPRGERKGGVPVPMGGLLRRLCARQRDT